MDGLVKHPWCGHGVLMNRTKQPWQNSDYVFRVFASRGREARRRYREFVEEGISGLARLMNRHVGYPRKSAAVDYTL
jgi:hypothetical protein